MCGKTYTVYMRYTVKKHTILRYTMYSFMEKQNIYSKPLYIKLFYKTILDF